MTTQQFTKGETKRRIRQIIAEAKALDAGIKSNYIIEIGTRTHPVYAKSIGGALRTPKDDDLCDFNYLGDACRTVDEIRGHGYVVHIYFTSTGDAGELVSVVTGWLGNDEHEPCLLRNDNGYVIEKPKKAKQLASV